MKKTFLVLFALLILPSCIPESSDLQPKTLSAPVSTTKPTVSNDLPVPLTIASFDDCKSAGYPIMGSNPRRCRTPHGEIFTEAIECSDDYEAVCAKVRHSCASADDCPTKIQTMQNRCLARQLGSDLLAMAAGECAEALETTCSADSDCALPQRLETNAHCVYDLKCLDHSCVVICSPPLRD